MLGLDETPDAKVIRNQAPLVSRPGDILILFCMAMGMRATFGGDAATQSRLHVHLEDGVHSSVYHLSEHLITCSTRSSTPDFPCVRQVAFVTFGAVMLPLYDDFTHIVGELFFVPLVRHASRVSRIPPK